MTARTDETISQLEAAIADSVGSQRYSVWFKNATQFAFMDHCLHVLSPNHFVGNFIERHFSSSIGEAVRKVTGEDHTLCFGIDPELARGMRKKQPDRQADYVTSETPRATRRPRQGDLPDTPATLRGRLEHFVVGPSNQLAHAAASSVVGRPGSDFRCLFLHGGCGLGKTHLLQGICNGLAEKHPKLHWRYVSGEEFTNDYVYAVKSREQDAFRARYRQLDVLAIDDVHFLANKRATQEEFLHTFQAIDAVGKQIVLASDAPPKMIGQFTEQLISRFVQGMVLKIDSPDLSVRVKFLMQRARVLNMDLSESVLQHIAESFSANVRELEGALLKFVMYAQTHQQPMTRSLADRAIRDMVRQTAPVVMLSDIESMVAIYFGIMPADLHTSRKTRTIALARSIAMYLARKHTDMSYPEIGRFMGNKDHTTVILANRRVSKNVLAGEAVRWSTHSGEREQKIEVIIQQIEQQFFRPGNTPPEPLKSPGAPGALSHPPQR